MTATALEGTEHHPHAAAVLGAALPPTGTPRTPTCSTGPAGTGKRTVARAFAAALLADGAPDPGDARARVQRGSHPDLTWVTPSGAHELLVSDVDEPVVAAAARTPFEAAPPRVRDRARGHDERRGRQPDAQDARGARGLRPPDPAHRPARRGAADDRLALPARALRPAARGRDRRAPGAGVGGERAGQGVRAAGAGRRGPRAPPGHRRRAGAARGRRALRPRGARRDHGRAPVARAARARPGAAAEPAAELDEAGFEAELELLAKRDRRRAKTEHAERARRRSSAAWRRGRSTWAWR